VTVYKESIRFETSHARKYVGGVRLAALVENKRDAPIPFAEFNVVCTTADGCGKKPLLAAILQEATSRLSGARIASAAARG
jgi:hypothetical protein